MGSGGDHILCCSAIEDTCYWVLCSLGWVGVELVVLGIGWWVRWEVRIVEAGVGAVLIDSLRRLLI